MTLADRIAVMKDGLVQQLGTPNEIYDDPVNQFVAGFMGSPPMNFVPCDVNEDGSLTICNHREVVRLKVPQSDRLKDSGVHHVTLGLTEMIRTEARAIKSVDIEHVYGFRCYRTDGADTIAIGWNDVEILARLA